MLWHSMHRGTTEQKAYQAIRYQNEIWLHTSRISRSYEKVSPSLSLSLSLSLYVSLFLHNHLLKWWMGGWFCIFRESERTAGWNASSTGMHRLLKAPPMKCFRTEIKSQPANWCFIAIPTATFSPLDLNFCSILMNQWKCCDMFQWRRYKGIYRWILCGNSGEMVSWFQQPSLCVSGNCSLFEGYGYTVIQQLLVQQA